MALTRSDVGWSKLTEHDDLDALSITLRAMFSARSAYATTSTVSICSDIGFDTDAA